MAGLPPRPVERSPQREREDYTQQRRYSPDRRPEARPMAPQPRYREERLSEDDRSYRPPRTHTHMEYDSYVASQQNSRREEEVRRMETYDRRDRERYLDARARGYRDYRERERRHTWGDRERDERDWDRGSRTWEATADHERDRRQIYDRERRYDRRRGDTPPYDRYREPDARRDARPPVSPSRRAGPYEHPPEPSFRRASRSPRRREPSPATSYRARHPSRPRSPAPSPYRLKLGNHSITTSPRSSPPRLNRDHPGHDPHRKQPHGDRSTSPHRTPPHEPRPINPNQEMRDEHPALGPVKSEDRISPSALHSLQTPAGDIPRPKTKSRSRSRSPAPLRSRSPEHPIATSPLERPREDKGKLKDEPQNDVEGDVKMRDPSPSPPKHPRYRSSAPIRGGTYGHHTSRSPPRGPRNYARMPIGPSSPASFPPTAPRGPRRPHPGIASTSTSNPVPPSAPPPAETPSVAPSDVQPIQPTTPFPVIPSYKPRHSLTVELDGEIARIQGHRAHLTSEYTNIAKATRRALHELEIATIDLRAAESRRKVADAQMEKARSGVLGIDAVQVDSKVV